MSAGSFVVRGTFQENAVEAALSGHWCYPLEGEAGAGRFGGEF